MAVITIVAALAGCSGLVPIVPPGADPHPWDRPVEGAVAVTEWRDDGQPTAPFGPGGPNWGHPEELLDAMAGAMAQQGVDAVAALASQNASGAVVGWIRLGADDRPHVATDLRVDLRTDGGSWHVVGVTSRAHCAEALEDGECR